MRRVPPIARPLLLGLAAAAVAFPIASIGWRQEEGRPAGLTAGAVWIGAGVAAAGYALLLLRTALRAARSTGAWRTAAPRIAAAARSRAVHVAGLAVLAAAAVAIPFVLPRQGVNLAFETLIYATLAVGLNIVVGYAGLLVLGYAAFWAIGAYTFALLALRLDVSLWAALPAAGAASMAAGFLIGLPSLRLRGDYLAIVTLGFGEVVYYLLKTEASFTGGEMGLPNKDILGDLQNHTSILGSGPLIEPHHYYWPALGLLLLAVFVVRRVERSRVGRAMMAMREDETAARCMGIHATRLKLTAFAFAAMWAGLAGVLYAAKTNYTNPKFFDFMQSIMVLAMVVLGGLGSIAGSIVGAVLLTAGPPLLRVWFPEFQSYRLLVFGGLMVLLMVYRPQGLFGSARLRLGRRSGEVVP